MYRYRRLPFGIASAPAVSRDICSSTEEELETEFSADNPTPAFQPNLLLSYRSTPHTTTGVSPAELFLKRQLRVHL